jgi:hypothetical protein
MIEWKYVYIGGDNKGYILWILKRKMIKIAKDANSESHECHLLQINWLDFSNIPPCV